MAGRNHQQFEKRQRERAKQQKAEAKRTRRAEKKDGEEGEDGPELTEDELLEQVRILNEQRAAGEVDEETYEERKT